MPVTEKQSEAKGLMYECRSASAPLCLSCRSLLGTLHGLPSINGHGVNKGGDDHVDTPVDGLAVLVEDTYPIHTQGYHSLGRSEDQGSQ